MRSPTSGWWNGLPFDAVGQLTAVLAMSGLTYGAIEAGVAGFAAPRVIAAFVVAVAAGAASLRLRHCRAT
jgi:MFS transporter, DHA2 family, methylenomycin A resistance protein